MEEVKFNIFENGKQVGIIEALNSFYALSKWESFTGPGNYTAILQDIMQSVNMIDWKNYSEFKPEFPGIYLVSYPGYHHIIFKGSYWNGKEFDDPEVKVWSNPNWPNF